MYCKNFPTFEFLMSLQLFLFNPQTVPTQLANFSDVFVDIVNRKQQQCMTPLFAIEDVSALPAAYTGEDHV